MSLVQQYFKSNIEYFQRNEIRVSVIGNKTKITESLIQVINETEEATKGYKNKHLILAIDYSGKFDTSCMLARVFVKKSEKGLIREEDVDETLIERELLTNCSDFPNPDLLIRTSGELNRELVTFSCVNLLTQSSSTRQSFGLISIKNNLLEALASYQRRERRFGAQA